MASDGRIMVHMVELLGVWPGEARIGASSQEEPVVIVTVRPEPNSFQSHNFGLSLAQAERLWEDLGSILGRSVMVLLVALLALAATGCSAKVEVERAHWNKTSSESTGEKGRTAVQVELLHDQSHKAIPQPSERKSGTVDQGRVNISGGTVIIIVPGDRPSTQEKAADKSSRKTETQSGHTGLQTRIGWPSDYWRHGFLAFGGSLVIWMLVGWAAWNLITCVFCNDKPDDPKLPIVVTLVLLVAAAVVLQFLPATDSGLQFLPLMPWAYAGFVAAGLSVVCWIGIVIAALVVVARRTDAPAVFSAAMLLSMGCNLLLSFLG